MFNSIRSKFKAGISTLREKFSKHVEKVAGDADRTDLQKQLEDAGVLLVKPNRSERRAFHHGNRVRSRSSRKSSTFAHKKGGKRDESGLIRHGRLIHEAVNSKKSVLARMGFGKRATPIKGQ